MQRNNTIFFALHNLANQSTLFDKVVIFIAGPFGYIILFLAALFLLFHHDNANSNFPISEFIRRLKEVALVFFSVFLAWSGAAVLKLLIHAPRPFIVFPNIHPLFTDSTFAFPSSHAAIFSALAVALFLSHKKIGYEYMFFALLIGLARIIAGVHFPIDILGGYILGTLIALFLCKKPASTKTLHISNKQV